MDDNELYPIGEVAGRTGLSVSAVRFYADAGIVTPTGHTEAGYRLYDVQAIARLELVRTLRELDAGLDDIRRLLADETTLRDLATTHLALVEDRMRSLRARRAVLRTIVKQHSLAEQVTLMHKLVSLSDDDRDRLIDQFWDEVSAGLDVHPAFVELLHRMRPNLPEEPTTGQLEAWIELADLVLDDDFRRSVREFFHHAFSAARARQVTAPPTLELIERHRRIVLEAKAAQQSGLPPDSPRAQEIAGRLAASAAELAGEADSAQLRSRLAGGGRGAAESPRAKDFRSRFTGALGRYHSLVATINGTPQLDLARSVVAREWLADALEVPGPAGGS
ncbi:MerR family transcriptional regulator [Amycolatopsis sp. NBC_00345]|uniref:MerR family transcriptional regulator n=1 Tax=Amycolatopsis sp. NBC_00345 TaxID=2975955 RepID=UPI002E263A14